MAPLPNLDLYEVPDLANHLDDPVLKELINLIPSLKPHKDVLEALVQDRAAAAVTKPINGAVKAGQPTAAARLWARLRAAALLWLVWLTLPSSLALVAANAAWGAVKLLWSGEARELWRRLRAAFGRRGPHRGTAIVSGAKSTKGLHVCRHLHRAGWRVVLVDTHKNWVSGARFSGCVAAFHTTPIPNKDPVGYLKAMVALATREDVKLFVPVSIAQFSIYEALAAELLRRRGCAACTLDAQSVAVLNDKIKFTAFCGRVGARVPRCFGIVSRAQLLTLNQRPEVFGGQRFLLKSVHYSAVHRTNLFTLPCPQQDLEAYTAGLDISPMRPWLLQQLLVGREFSCNAVAFRGRLIAFADTDAELSNLNYAHAGVPQIRRWVEQFCDATGASGQLCFDFMKSGDDGQLYSFECNPRTSTVLLEYHDHPGFAQALFDPQGVIAARAAPLLPRPGSPPVHWVWNELGELILSKLPRARSVAALRKAVSVTAQRLATGVDAVLDGADPLPFLGLHYVQVPGLLLRTIRTGNPWLKVDLCTGKMVELGGD